jgi:hypothetical protein
LALVACAAPAVLLMIAGCGGSSGSSESASGGELSHSEWVSRADAVCQKDHEANASLEAEFGRLLGQGLTTPTKRGKAAKLIRGAIPTVETEVGELEEVTAPVADELKAAEVLKELELTVALDRRLAVALEDGSDTELEIVAQEVQGNGTALQGLAKDLGLKVCGRPEAGE